VPVFDTGAEPIGASEREQWEAERHGRMGTAEPDPDLTADPSDWRMLSFPPRPEPTAAIFFAGGLLVTAWLLAYADELQTRLLFVLVLLLLAAGLVRDLFYGISLEIAPDELVIRHRVLGLGPTRRVHPGEIRDIQAGMVRGSSGSRWQVTLNTVDDITCTAATNLTTRAEAERTARRIRRAIEAASGRPLQLRT
jgi:hypothetical protein